LEQVVILGGGIAGMQTAIALNDMGIKSVLVEKEPKLGGKVKDYDNTFPFFRSGKTLVRELEERINTSSLIEVRTGTEATAVTGTAPNFQIVLTTLNQRVPASAIVVATGFEHFDASLQEEHGYGVYPNVITASDMERLLDYDGPTNGELTRPSDGKIARRIALIFCVGSRSEKLGHNYCSRICCSFSTKQAIEIKERYPDARVMCFYMDIRTYGRGFEEMYRRAQELEINYIRGRVAECGMLPNGDITIKAEDTLLGKPARGTFDLVSLSTGMTPCPDSPKIASMLGIKLAGDGFYDCANSDLFPNDATREGIFLAGSAIGAKPIPDCIADGNVAATRVAVFLRKQILPQGFY